MALQISQSLADYDFQASDVPESFKNYLLRRINIK